MSIRASITLNEFLELPRKCQEMFFESLENTTSCDQNPYSVFACVGFDYSDCKSPTEKIFLMAYTVINFTCYQDMFALIPQAEIRTDKRKYIADFLVDSNEDAYAWYFGKERIKIVIECDGHDFHKLTKQQVKHDNERDFALKKAGYDVLHFSGTQIYESPWRCANDTIRYIAGKMQVKTTRTGESLDSDRIKKWLDRML